jgi:hypothetical protein
MPSVRSNALESKLKASMACSALPHISAYVSVKNCRVEGQLVSSGLTREYNEGKRQPHTTSGLAVMVKRCW